jgi:hypothetical protein
LWFKEGSTVKRNGLTTSKGQYSGTNGGIGVLEVALEVEG